MSLQEQLRKANNRIDALEAGLRDVLALTMPTDTPDPVSSYPREMHGELVLGRNITAIARKALGPTA